MTSHRRTVLALSLLCLVPTLPARLRAGEADEDERLLRGQGLGTDTSALLDFFRKRSLTGAERPRMAALVRQLGSNQYDEREAAARELAARGPAVRELLRGAVEDADPE